MLALWDEKIVFEIALKIKPPEWNTQTHRMIHRQTFINIDKQQTTLTDDYYKWSKLHYKSILFFDLFLLHNLIKHRSKNIFLPRCCDNFRPLSILKCLCKRYLSLEKYREFYEPQKYKPIYYSYLSVIWGTYPIFISINPLSWVAQNS